MDQEWLGMKANPLQFRDILYVVFQYLKSEDLLSCRLVNGLWHRTATKESRKLQQDTVIFDDRYQFDTFLYIMKTSSFLPVAKVSLNCFPIEKTLLLKFLEKCGLFLEELSIKICWRDRGVIGCTSTNLMEGVQLEFPMLKNLTLMYDSCEPPACPIEAGRTEILRQSTLASEMDVHNSKQEANSVYELFKSLLEVSENLLVLKLQVLSSLLIGEELSFQLTHKLSSAVLTAMKKPLKKLELSADMKEGFMRRLLRRLKNQDIKLDSLKLIPHYLKGDILEDTLVSILKTQKDTLESLELGIGIDEFKHLPVLPAVENLNLSGVYGSDFNFAESFPKLKRLCYCIDDYEPDDVLEMKHFPPSSLERLRVENLEETDDNLVISITMRFPYLTSLRIGINGVEEGVADLLKPIFTLKLLENLFIQEVRSGNPIAKPEHEIDSLLTGMSTGACQTILKNGSFQMDLAKSEGPLSLLNLKNLTVFVIEKKEVNRKDCTDVTGKMVLLNMPKLQRCGIKNHAMSAGCIKLLQSKFQFEDDDVIRLFA